MPRHADRFAPLPPAQTAPWMRFAQWEEPYYAKHLGMEVVEVREDYARMRLPCRTEVLQLQGVVHGGAIASLIDTAVVPAIAAASDRRLEMVTLSLHVNYVAAATGDVVAEAWVVRRGGSTVFCQADVFEEKTDLHVATGTLVYRIRPLDQ